MTPNDTPPSRAAGQPDEARVGVICRNWANECAKDIARMSGEIDLVGYFHNAVAEATKELRAQLDSITIDIGSEKPSRRELVVQLAAAEAALREAQKEFDDLKLYAGCLEDQLDGYGLEMACKKYDTAASARREG